MGVWRAILVPNHFIYYAFYILCHFISYASCIEQSIKCIYPAQLCLQINSNVHVLRRYCQTDWSFIIRIHYILLLCNFYTTTTLMSYQTIYEIKINSHIQHPAIRLLCLSTQSHPPIMNFWHSGYVFVLFWPIVLGSV